MNRTGLSALTTAALLLLLLPATSAAQERSWYVAAGAGPSVAMGTLAEEVGNGFHLQGSVGVAPRVLPFGLRFDLFYQNFDAVEREPTINRSLGGEWFRQLSGLVNAQYALPLGTLQPYALVGGGWIREWHDDRTYYPDAQTTVNLNLGGGVHFPLLGAKGFLEARYLNIVGGEALPLRPPAFNPEVQFRSIPITLGVSF